MSYTIRPAQEKDIDPIHSLISHYALQGVILERSREDIHDNLENFLVAEDSGIVIGAATFYDYGETLKEIRSFAIDENYHGRGIGSSLLKKIVERLIAKTQPVFLLLPTSLNFSVKTVSPLSLKMISLKKYGRTAVTARTGTTAAKPRSSTGDNKRRANYNLYRSPI